MKHISLFSGIGGFDLAAQWVGWTNVASCEIAEFPRKVLQYHFPNAYHHDDIHTLTYEKLNDELTKRFGKDWQSDKVILTGGFPCQPYSLAGKREGKNDSRHLWPEMLRVIREIKPTWVVGENVYGLVNWNGGLVFDEVHTDLEAEGFEVQAFVLPAAGVGAPHRRDRVWFVAYAAGNGTPQNGRSGANEGGRETSIFSQDEGRESKTIQPTGLCSLQRFAVDADNKRRSARLRQIQDADAEVSERNNDAELSNAGDGLTTDPTGNQNQRHGQGGFFTEPAGVDEQGIAADPNSKGFQDGIERGATERAAFEEERAKSFDNPRDWANFPTAEPTIRRGDDGISERLDSISFPKWRNESIKAYGNAVVPQVVYRIFKAIEAYETP